MLRGEAGVRRSWPAASRSLDFVCVWTVAVAVVDQVVFWRLASASGCRAGPVATVRKRRRRVPFSGKICRRRAWHRGERWVDGGAAFLWLGLSCPFFPLCWSCWTETPPEGPGPPRRGPVVNGGDEANPRAKVSAGICCPRHRCWPFPALCAPLFSDIQRRPLSACLSACGLSMCTGGRHPRRPHVPHAGLLDRRDPASVHSTEHCLVADFLFSCTWQEKKPTTNNGDRHSRRPKRGALQRRCRSGGGGPPSSPAAANSLCFVLGRGCVRLCPPSHPAGRLGWAGLGVVCLRGRRAVVAEVAPTTHNQSSSA